jgi:16S rRNA (uracil1498-N3)-methyltransferase
MPREVVELSTTDSHYLRDVLRLSSGDAVEIGERAKGVVFHGEIESVGALVTVRLLDEIPRAAQETSISLLCALCKGQKNEQIIDWATELGVSQIIFFQAERSVVRLRSTEDLETKIVRFSKIATAAAQQSRQATPPAVIVTLSLEEALPRIPAHPSLLKAICSLAPEATPLGHAVQGLPSNSHVCVVIGPEGDLSPDEHATLIEAGFTPTALGPKVLRSELAVVMAIATIQTARLGS